MAEKPPPGVAPLFLTSMTQDAFHLKTDVDVTQQSPWKYVKKEAVMKDITMRGVISDFSVHKEAIKSFQGEDVLAVYDREQVYGQNFYLALSQAAIDAEMKRKHDLENPPPPTTEEGAEGGEAGAEQGTPAQQKKKEREPFVAYGADKEILAERINPNRPLIKFQALRKHRDFAQPYKFSNKDAAESSIDQRTYKEFFFDLKRLELDKSCQAVPVLHESSSQTHWHRSVPAAVQCDSSHLMEALLGEFEITPVVEKFVRNAAPRIEFALRQNETLHVFRDDFVELGDEDSLITNKADNIFKEAQSFTHITFSKGKKVSAIDWQPKSKGVVAIACMENMNFDERMKSSGKIISSFALVWNFADPIHPQLLLEAPFELLCLKFNPSNPNLIAGGCINGQVVVWDITEALETSKAHSRDVDEDGGESNIPKVRWKMASSTETAHKRAVNDIQWLPDGMETTQEGKVTFNSEGKSYQLASISTDRHVLVWETNPVKLSRKGSRGGKRRGKDDDPDFPWAPILRCQLSRTDGGNEVAGFRLSLDGKQSPATFTCTGEDGEIAFGDWTPAEQGESEAAAAAGGGASGAAGGAAPHGPSNVVSGCVKQAFQGHFGPVVDLQRSPFFDDLYLTVGDWSFRVWKKGVEEPIVSGPFSDEYLLCGRWSNTRPSVLFIGTKDGRVEVWDLLDRTHEPSMVQHISSSGISSIEFWKHETKATRPQMLAMGDEQGTLRVFEVPRTYSRPVANEIVLMQTFTSREIRRVEYFNERWDVRRKEFDEIQEQLQLQAQQEAAGGPPPPQATSVPDDPDQALIEEEFLNILKAGNPAAAPPAAAAAVAAK